MFSSFCAVGAVLLLFLLLCAVKKIGGEKAVRGWEKAIGVLLLFLVIAKGFFQDSFLLPINNDETNLAFIEKPYDLAETLIRWLLGFSEAFAIASVFVDSKAIRRVLVRFSLPLCALSLIYLNRSIGYLTEDLGEEVWLYGFRAPSIVRTACAIAERAFVILLPLSFAFLSHRGEYLAKSAKRAAAKHLWLGIVFSMPFFTPGTLFGVTDYVIGIGDPLQFVWIAGILFAFLAVFLAYRKENLTERSAIMTFLIVTLTMHYSNFYLHGFRMNRLPLQLCNLATYLLLLLLFVKKNWLYDFIVIANCPGCVIAIATVTEDSPMFCFWAMHYYVQHTLVFIIPLLLCALGVYRMPKSKEAIKHYFLGFTFFYLLCLFLGAYENGVLSQNSSLDSEIFNHVNFFYLEECPVDALSGLYNALCIGKVTIFGADYYLGYLAFIYTVFSLLAIGEYYLNRLIGRIFSGKRARANA